MEPLQIPKFPIPSSARFSAYDPDDPFSPFSIFNTRSHSQINSPNLRYSLPQNTPVTCRFGHGLHDDPRPPSLPLHEFRQLACSSCLLYVANVKQKCNLEYIATPDGLVANHLPPERTCLSHNQSTGQSTELRTAVEIGNKQFEGATNFGGHPRPNVLSIPETLTQLNFFCDVLLQSEDEHCNLWRECCNAAIDCCKNISNARQTKETQGESTFLRIPRNCHLTL